MNNARLITRAGVAILALLVCAAPASAQRLRPDRPYRGLFGGNGADPDSKQQFDLNVSLFGAYDDNVLGNVSQSALDPRFQQNGRYGGGTASLDYTRRTRRVTFDFTGGTSYRYYPSLRQLNSATSFASAGFSAKLSPRTDLRATESVSYLPFYSFGAVPGLTTASPGDVAPINPDYPLLQQTAISLSSSASLDHRLTPRASFAADYMIQYTDYRPGNQLFGNWAVGGALSWKMTRHAAARFGYHYDRGTTGLPGAGQGTNEGHTVNLGIDFSHPLSPLRTMTYGFSVGTSRYTYLTSAGTTPSASLSTSHLLVTATGYLNRQISRSWTAGLSYNRGVQYVQGFSSPFFSDSVSANLSGFAGPRSRLNFTAAYSSGQVGIATSGQGYSTYSGVAGYQVAMGRFMALFADYNYYHYVFDPTVALPAGMNRGLNRQSVRVGVNLWVPLLR